MPATTPAVNPGRSTPHDVFDAMLPSVPEAMRTSRTQLQAALEALNEREVPELALAARRAGWPSLTLRLAELRRVEVIGDDFTAERRAAGRTIQGGRESIRMHILAALAAEYQVTGDEPHSRYLELASAAAERCWSRHTDALVSMRRRAANGDADAAALAARIDADEQAEREAYAAKCRQDHDALYGSARADAAAQAAAEHENQAAAVDGAADIGGIAA